MIPADRMHPIAVSNLLEYLRFEIPKAESERRGLEEKWIKYHNGYKCVPEFKMKEFPFLGASNMVLPVIATDVDTIFSRLMGILFGPSNLWSCKALMPEMVPYAPRLQEFLEWAQNAELGVYDAVADWILELSKLGTGVLKQRYRREQKRVFQFRETDQGTIQQHLNLLVHDHPVVEHVSLWDFLVPAEAIGIQESPWVAERIRLTPAQLMARERAGIYVGTQRLMSFMNHERGSNVLQHMQRLDQFVPGMSGKADLWEGWLDYDISGTGEPEALVCTIHLPSMTYLRLDYNPYMNQERPYSAARYLRQEKRFYGIGLAEMLEHFQEEVTTMHNQRIDNQTLANSTMFKAKRGLGIQEDEPVYPGRWFITDDPTNDIVPLVMGQRFDSTVNEETMTLGYGARRTGVNDYISGDFSNAMGYSTATVGVQQLRESAKRFDQTMREVRIALGETGTRVVELYQQFNQGGKEYMAMGAEDGAVLHGVLQFPMELIRMGVGIELTATSASFNKEVEIRVNTIIMQMLMQYYTQAMQALSYYLNPQLPEPIRMMALKMAEGGSILLRRILDTYGVQDRDRLIPEIAELLNGGQQQLGAIGQAIGGGQGGLGGAVQAGGMGPAQGLLPGPAGFQAA